MSKISPKILHEDTDIIVIHKPSGMVVNEAQSNQVPTIQTWVTEYLQTTAQLQKPDWQQFVPSDFDATYGSPEDIWQERQGIVHRLDKDTSGVLILAKHPGALVELLRQFRSREVKKTYTCLVHGGMSLAKGLINAPIHRAQRDRRKFAVDASGRQAVTLYETLGRYEQLRCLSKQTQEEPADNSVLEEDDLSEESQRILRKNHDTYLQGFSLLSCQPKTGRTHQIRVHLAHLHHPVVGDQVYAGRQRCQLDALWCPRQFLHARELKITHPRTHESMTFTAELPADLTKVLRQLV